MFWPTEQQRAAAHFENTYLHYQVFLTRHGRVPASREAILEEARTSPRMPIELLTRKMMKLEP